MIDTSTSSNNQSEDTATASNTEMSAEQITSEEKKDTICREVEGILGTKIGMTKIFNDQGEIIPVTLIQAGPCPVMQVRKKEIDGYTALQLGYYECDEKKINKPLAGQFRKVNLKPYRWLRELHINNTDGVQIGQEIKIDIFSEGDFVNVSGLTKGKGFQGVVKRHNFAGGPKTHGQSNRQRSPGAIGAQRPQRVKKGTLMAGHMGHRQRTIRNLAVVRVILEKNLLAIKGSIPGPNNSFVIIRKSKKKTEKKTGQAMTPKKLRGKGKAPRETARKR